MVITLKAFRHSSRGELPRLLTVGTPTLVTATFFSSVSRVNWSTRLAMAWTLAPEEFRERESTASRVGGATGMMGTEGEGGVPGGGYWQEEEEEREGGLGRS